MRTNRSSRRLGQDPKVRVRWVRTPIYRGDSLGADVEIQGPAIIEEPTTTIVVFPEMSARRSAAGNYLLEIPTMEAAHGP